MTLSKVVNGELSDRVGQDAILSYKGCWRFLDTGSGDAYTNMAIDEALALNIRPGERPILRLYAWHPYAISLGYNQKVEDLDLQRCQKDGIDVVRRPTGGRAVLHAQEVTYSVIIPKDHPCFSRDILSTYNFISRALTTGLKILGVPASLEKQRSGNSDSQLSSVPCFSSTARYEIVFQGKKLVGSAQRRFEHSILQHGSILTGEYHLKLANYLSLKGNSTEEKIKQQLATKTVSLSQILDRPIAYKEVVEAIKKGFEKQHQITFCEDQLTSQEVKGANLLLTKYRTIRR
ncbi:MAG: lipoate--protein ligase family protein [candidate division KSB1 bacterium]|nr:lipoate--protein ligase family protein [candidate division KSB1 bacterium]